MDSLLLSSKGFDIGRFAFPTFQLRVGEYVCLHLPEEIISSEVEVMIAVLTGEKSVDGMRHLSSVRWAAPPRNRYGLSRLFRPMRVSEWFQQVAAVSPSQTQAVLERLSFQGHNCFIGQLAGTTKTLLSLEAAWLSGAQVVVFTTAGLDPLGRQAIFEAVASRLLQGGAALHLSYSFLQNGERKRECFPGSSCLEVKAVRQARESGLIGTKIR